MTITVIVGLPGSGKTQLANRIFSDRKIYDDVQIQLNLLEQDCVVIHPCFCLEENRNNFVEGVVHDVEFLYFDNDYETCIENVNERNDGRNVIPDIMALKNKYKPPYVTYNVYNKREIHD